MHTFSVSLAYIYIYISISIYIYIYICIYICVCVCVCTLYHSFVLKHETGLLQGGANCIAAFIQAREVFRGLVQ